MASIPHASKYRNRNPSDRGIPPGAQGRVGSAQQQETAGWIIGLGIFLTVVISLLVVTEHPWFAVIGATASGATLTHLLNG